MTIESIEKDLAKYQKLLRDLEKQIAVGESKIQDIMARLKKDYKVNSIEEADKLLSKVLVEKESLSKEIARRMQELNSKYGNMI